MSLTISSSASPLAPVSNAATIGAAADSSTTSSSPAPLNSEIRTIQQALTGTKSLISNLAAALSVIERANGTAVDSTATNGPTNYYTDSANPTTASTPVNKAATASPGSASTTPDGSGVSSGAATSGQTPDSNANQVTFQVAGVGPHGAAGSVENTIDITISVNGTLLTSSYIPVFNEVDPKATAVQTAQAIDKYADRDWGDGILNTLTKGLEPNAITQSQAQSYGAFVEQSLTDYLVNHNNQYTASTLEAALNNLTSSEASGSSGASPTSSSGSTQSSDTSVTPSAS